MSIFFSSDHSNIIRYCNRPFTSVEEMNEYMVKAWNETVQPEDTVFYIGDFSLAIRPVELFLSRLNGIKILIVGNHDFCHPAHPKSKTIDKHFHWCNHYKELGFSDVLQDYSLVIGSEIVLLSHMPYLNADNKSERYPQYRPKDQGQWLLHGHVHDKWKVKDKMINVGVDVWNFYPVALSAIKEIMNDNNREIRY